MSIATDLAYAITGYGSVPVVFGAVTSRGMEDWEQEPRVDGSGETVLVNVHVVHVIQSVFSALATGDSITVNSASYKVRDVRRIDDGLILKVFLA